MSDSPIYQGSDPQEVERNEVLNAIVNKWNKFSKHELSLLKTNDELMRQIVIKYGLDDRDVQREVAALLAGRNL